MARLHLHCAYCGMPAVTLLHGTAVCNDGQCQARAGLAPSPPLPREEQTPHGSGVARRVPGPNEVVVDEPSNVRRISQGVLCKGATGLEVQNVDDVTNKLHICHSEEVRQVLDFLAEHFPDAWPDIVNWFLATVPGARLDAPEEPRGKALPTGTGKRTANVELPEHADDPQCGSLSPRQSLEDPPMRCELPADMHLLHRNGSLTWRRLSDESRPSDPTTA